MQSIKAVDLQAQYRAIQSEIDEAVARVLSSGQYLLGAETGKFEAEFSTYSGVAHAAAVGSGTDAIQLALRACEIGPGDEVITVAHTAVACIAAIELSGASPVLVDIDPRSFTIDPEKIEAAVGPRTRAILPVHLYGCPADLEPILDIAQRRNLRVIEDCSQAHGARYHGRPVGSLGHLAAFSFYPTKNLGAMGDGGAVLTNDARLDERVRKLRQYGWRERNCSDIRGVNSRMDEIQAAVLRVKLRHLEEWTERRRALAALYSNGLAGCGVVLPTEPAGSRHVYHQYVIRHTQRDELRSHLAAQGIQTQVHYPVPVHLQPAYRGLPLPPGGLPASECAAREVLSLPIRPEMSVADVERVCEEIGAFASGQALPSIGLIPS